MAESDGSKEAILAKLNQLDQEGEQYMKHAEKKCCRIKLGQIPFSPEASLWIHRCQVYRSLLRWHAGKIWNQGNLKCTARRNRIGCPFFLSVEELKVQLGICKQKCNYFWKHGKRHCPQHLDQCLVAAKDRADDDTKQKSWPSYDRKKIVLFGKG
jgi:hypothetical protein